jgi:hypothetical protein
VSGFLAAIAVLALAWLLLSAPALPVGDEDW